MGQNWRALITSNSVCNSLVLFCFACLDSLLFRVKELPDAWPLCACFFYTLSSVFTLSFFLFLFTSLVSEKIIILYVPGRNFPLHCTLFFSSLACHHEHGHNYCMLPGKQQRFIFTFVQDPKHGNWWLEFGNGVLVGYWPSFLFTHLRDHASMVQFGGEIVNSMPSGFHTSTQMGSGHFAGEGFGKASYFRNLQVVDWDNNLLPLSNLRVLADHPNCYDIQGGINRVWGNYFYYGGPGRNVRCP